MYKPFAAEYAKENSTKITTMFILIQLWIQPQWKMPWSRKGVGLYEFIRSLNLL